MDEGNGKNIIIKKMGDIWKENRRVLTIVSALIVLFLISAHIRGCLHKGKSPKAQARPVTTAEAVSKDVPLKLRSFGVLTSPEDVDVRSQVTGKIQKVHFTQGSRVSEGELLFTIDPSEYKAEVDKAKAMLSKDKAMLKLQEDLYQRNRTMHEKKLISDQDFDKIKSDLEALKAQVALDKAALQLAEVQLEYCYIKSPINGVAGRRRVDPGNVVQANTGPVLVNISRIDELYFDFTLPEQHLPDVRQAMAGDTLTLNIMVRGDNTTRYSGELDFIDNEVNTTTGTFSLRGAVSNQSGELWPGQFAKVELKLGTQKNAVVAPYEAVQLGKKGYYLFAVTGKGTAELRNVKTGQRYGDHIVIHSGVKSGETVVTSGQMGLAPGVPVIDTKKGTGK